MILLFITLLLIAASTIAVLQAKLAKGTFIIKDFNVERTLPLRGILALLIVTHHLSQQVASQDIPIFKEFVVWGAVVVGMFFFITGYGLMVSYMKKGTAYIDNFLTRRFFKLLPPFIVAMIGYVAAMAIFADRSIVAQFAGLLYGSTPLPHSWYVWAVILFYLLFYVSAKLFKQVSKIIIALWILSTLYFITLKYIGWGSWWYISIYALNIGLTFAYYEHRIKAFLEKRPKWIALVSAILAVGLCAVPSIAWLLQLRYVKFVGVLAIYWLAPLLVVLAIYVMGMVQNKSLNFLGRYSYEIYLMQGFWIVGLHPLSSNWILYAAATYIGTIFSGWLLNRICTFHWIHSKG